MDYEKELSQLKELLDQAKGMKYKAEARLEQLKNSEEEIIKELDGLGIKPENLDEEIDKLKKEIEELINEANGLLPKDILGK